MLARTDGYVHLLGSLIGSAAVRVMRVHGVRYQVKDVARASAFYTSLGGFALLLSGPGLV